MRAHFLGLKLNNIIISNFPRFEVVARGSETQLQMGGNLNYLIQCFRG